ncbi:MAG: ABC transporter ATP-binding protein [Alphaproteobacteria bacterium]|nr:MAG: ABC transporter ATP-binding protein [Alphaproteobacteria bacterium]
MHTDPILEVRALRAGYGATEILCGIDLSVKRGEIVAVLGSNGAGKSTLNLAISGVVRVRAGAVVFSGETISQSSASSIVGRGLVHVPEGRRIFPNLSVHDNLDLGSYRRGRAHREENRERVYGIFPRLRERRTQRAGTLSGGEQQMLAIGRGLMAEPQLIILDEPSLGLSPLLVEELFALIARLNRAGLAILLVEQNVMQSLHLAHRAYIMENGRIVMSGSAEEIRSNPDLKRAYLGM